MKHSAYLVLLLLVLLSLTSGVTPYALAGHRDEKLCPVHRVPLIREKQILYGHRADPCDTLDRIHARQEYFPYADVILRGESNLPDSAEYVEVLYCPKCREVEKTWPCLETRETGIVPGLPLPRVTKLPTVR